MTGKKPVMYECDDELNALLDLDVHAKVFDECMPKEGKAKLNEIWDRELILQYRYSDASDFTTEVWHRI